jgi:hypothetical protein
MSISPADHRLLRKQKNELFKIFRQKNIDSTEFNWLDEELGETVKRVISKLVHASGDFFFRIDVNQQFFPLQSKQTSFFSFLRTLLYKSNSDIDVLNIENTEQKWILTFSPNNLEKTGYGYADKWIQITDIFSKWCDWVKDEIVPDAWEQAKLNKLTGASENQEDKETQFSEDEQKSVTGALKEIREFIIENHKLSQEQLLSLDEKFEMLEIESSKMSKQAWLHTLIGVLFGFATNGAFAPERAHQLFDFAYTCLRPVLEAPLLLK